MRRFVPTIVAFVLLLSFSPSFAKFDPAFTWTTLETPHFYIHYHQSGEGVARHAAQVAEDVHARLAPRIKWEPKQKTHIVLVDAMDEANGMAGVMPYNQVILLLTQPVGEPGFGTTAYEDWMRLLITHEYTHVLQLDMINGGLGGVMQTLFGRLYFPNEWQPIWLIEGLAVYEETEQTPGGRGRSAGADMVLRMATLEGPFPPISRMTVFPDTWPSGDVPYLFGGSFIRFIADTYGREKLADLSITYSGRGFPFLVESTAGRVLGKNYGTLWDEWRTALRDKYEKQRREVEAKGLTASTVLTRKGYDTHSPAYSPDGSRMAYLEANGDEYPGIYVMNADGTDDRKVAENAFPMSASGMTAAWSADGSRLYYTKAEIERNTDYYDDIYYYDMKKDKEVRVTKMLRARDPDPSPDGKKLIFVTNRMGMTRLALLDISSEPRRPAGAGDVAFLTEESMVQYEAPCWSPDGSKIAVSLWQPGGYKDVWILDAEGKKLDEVMHDRAIDGAPAWGPDGKYIYFSSDRSGIYNLFAYELGTKKLFQITNVLGGAFSPSPSPDGKTLAFASYSAKGYDVHTITIDRATWKSAEPYKDPYPTVPYEERKFDTKTMPYSPLSTLAPRFWLPWFGYSYESGVLGGFLTLGEDVVQRHQYIVTGLYGPKTDRLWYSFDYLYDGLPPTIHVQASDTDVTYSDLLQDARGTKDYVERQKTYGLELIVPLVKNQTQHMVTIGYRWKEISALTKMPPWPGYSGPVPAEGVLASGKLSYRYNSSRRYNFSISPEQGRTIEFGYERLDKSLGSDFELNKYTMDWHEYIDFPLPHHVLLARFFAGTSTGQKLPQRAFSLGGDNPGDITLSIDSQDVFLRGYPANEFRGQNVALTSLEYRFPIENIERGDGQTPIFLRRVHGAVFGEAGNAWDGTFHGSDLKRAVGAEARMDLDLAYRLPVTLRLGIARGLDEKKETMIIFGLWVPVLY